MRGQEQRVKMPVGGVWSFRLETGFRSRFELNFAEVAVFNWLWKLYYEPSQFVVHVRGKPKLYIPDFFESRYGCWIETKGLWTAGAKEKFNAAVDLLGKDRLLLIPAEFMNDIGAINNG